MAAKFIDVGLYSQKNTSETTKVVSLGIAVYLLAVGEWLLLALLGLIYVTVVLPPKSAGKTTSP